MKKILLFITIILIIPSCVWLFPDCKGLYLYEINNYDTVYLYYMYKPENGEWRKIETDNFVLSFDDLSIDLTPSLNEIGITEHCSIMEHKVVDSILIFDIYANKDYNTFFQHNTNLNKMIFYGDSSVFDILNNGNLCSSLFLVFSQAPLQIDTFIFSIHIELNDKRTFDLETRPVIITP